MIHPDTELRFINPTIGWGVVATKLLPKGTITWVEDALDRHFTPEEVSHLPKEIIPHLEKYCFVNHLGHKILCWDHAKYVNHSFNPNCMSTAYDFEIALRDIYPGEQLTDDYGYLNVEEPFLAEDENSERKIVYPDDLLRYSHYWDSLIKERLPLLFTQEQALGKYLPLSVWQELQKVLNGQAELKSIRNCYYDPK